MADHDHERSHDRDLVDQVRTWSTAAAETALDPVTVDEVEVRADAPLPAASIAGRSGRRRQVSIVAAALLLLAGGIAVAVRSGWDDDGTSRIDAGGRGDLPTTGPSSTRPAPDGAGAAAGTWTDLGEGPLTPRRDAGVYWTGHEVLVVGGVDHDACPPNADCFAGDPPRRDGAAYDLATGTWRSIADAPVTFSDATGAVAGGRLYLVGDTAADDHGTSEDAFLRYDPAADSWTELPPPPSASWRSVVADGDRLVAYLGSHEQGNDLSDLVWDDGARTWTPIPRDPIAPSFDRSVVAVDGDLYVFGHDLVAQPGADGPSLLRGAVLHDGRWEELPPSETIGSGGASVGGVITSPLDGSADGGEVGNWGRSYPYAWQFDTRTQAWSDPPLPPDDLTGPHVAWAAGDDLLVWGDAVFDGSSRAWSGLAAPDELDRTGIGSTWAGDRLVVFGGSAGWDEQAEELDLRGDLWAWVPSG